MKYLVLSGKEHHGGLFAVQWRYRCATARGKIGIVPDCSISDASVSLLLLRPDTHLIGGTPLARTNFKYEKRQKELAKQAKAEEKRLRKLEKRNPIDEEGMTDPEDGVESPESEAGEASSNPVEGTAA